MSPYYTTLAKAYHSAAWNAVHCSRHFPIAISWNSFFPRKMHRPLHSYSTVCVSCLPWPGEELAWAGTSFPAGYLRDRGRTGAPGLPQPHPSSAFSWGLMGTSSCSIPTAFTAFTTLLMSWAAFEKPPYTIPTCERLRSLLSHAWKRQQRFPLSLQREWHRRVDVPTNFRGSAEATDTCTRFYMHLRQAVRWMSQQLRLSTAGVAANWKKHSGVLLITNGQGKTLPPVA